MAVRLNGPSPLLTLPGGAGEGVAFSPDGKTLAGYAGGDLIGMWRLATGERIATLVAPGSNGLALSHEVVM